MSDRTWMYLKNRTCGEYLTGLKSFIDAAEADQLKQGKSTISCPCVDCENDIQFSSLYHVHAHLIIRELYVILIVNTYSSQVCIMSMPI